MSEPEYRRIRREKAKKDQEAANRERHESAKNSRTEKIVSAINTIIEKLDGYRDEAKRENDGERRWRKAEVFGLWAAAFVGLVAISVASHDASSQRKVMQGQLKQMKDQLSITLVQLSPKLALSFTGPQQPLKIEGKAGWMVTPSWGNHGATDAIQFWGWDNAKMFGLDAPAGFDFLKFTGNNSGASLLTVNPNQTVYQLSKFISVDDVAAIIAGKGKFIVWGYVEYREALPGNKAHHVHWCYQVFPVDSGNSYIFSYSAYRPECNTSD